MHDTDNIADTISHDELLEITQSSLCTLLNYDTLLSDLPSDIIVEEILSQNTCAGVLLDGGRINDIHVHPSDPGGLCYSTESYLFKTSAPAIAVEHGQSITIFLSREDEPVLKVIVPQKASVGDLKKAIARHFEIHQKRTGNKVKISWKYIWKTYNLSFDGIILDNNSSPIDDYGVTNKVTLCFKKRRSKNK